jgi:hypothetical protein
MRGLVAVRPFNDQCHYSHEILMSANPMTGIPVRTDALRRIQDRKTGSKSCDEFLLDLVEDYDPPEWIAEMERRRSRGRDVSGSSIERLHAQLKGQGR